MSRSARLLVTFTSIIALPFAIGCGPRNQGALVGTGVGAAAGAGGGAIVGSTFGEAGRGAAVGAAAGAITGGAIGAVRDDAEAATAEEDRFIERQREQAQRQLRELEDIRRQKFHDDYYRSRYEREGVEAAVEEDGFGGY